MNIALIAHDSKKKLMQNFCIDCVLLLILLFTPVILSAAKDQKKPFKDTKNILFNR